MTPTDIDGVMQAVAECLGPDWTWSREVGLDEPCSWGGFLVGRGLRLVLDCNRLPWIIGEALDTWVPDVGERIKVTALYSAGEMQPTRRIVVSPEQGAAAVASDIQRHLLPAVEDIWKRFQQHREARLKRLARRRRAFTALHTAGPSGTVGEWFIVDRDAPVVTMLGRALTFTVEDENNIRVTWDGITLETAREVVRVAGGS